MQSTSATIEERLELAPSVPPLALGGHSSALSVFQNERLALMTERPEGPLFR